VRKAHVILPGVSREALAARAASSRNGVSSYPGSRKASDYSQRLNKRKRFAGGVCFVIPEAYNPGS
jgi:hypothetical protein